MILDPREYTKTYPKTNIIIQTAMDVKAGNVDDIVLDQIIANKLRDEQDAMINVALNLSPDNHTAQIIWNSLNNAVNSVDLNHVSANIFAIPLILVAGSKNSAVIKPQIDNDKLNAFFIDSGLFRPNSDCFISGKLIDPNTLATIKHSQLYYWVRNLEQAKLWLPVKLDGSAIKTMGEGVFLRFLIGVSIDRDNLKGLDIELLPNKLMGLMELINIELKTDGVTLFPIPFMPVPISRAFATGVEYRTEIAISVSISNVVKKIREERLTPYAKIDSEGEALRIIVRSREESNLIETLLWNLTKFASYEATVQQITNLLDDMGIEYDFAAD